jgi:lipopolysaccharide biosynthesis glycosyltransferase/tetratricopeptide (TPR) repeat protein
MNIATRTQDFASAAREIADRQNRRAALKFLGKNSIPADLAAVAEEDLRLWGDLAFTGGITDEAARIYERLIELQPDSYWPCFQLGRICRERGAYPQAVAMFLKASSLAPQAAGPWFELCRTYFRQKNIAKLKKAVAALCAAEREPVTADRVNVLTAIGHFLFDRKMRSEPLPLYALLIDSKVADSLVHARFSECLVATGQFQTVIAALEPLRRTRTIGDWGLRSLGLAYAGANELQLASEVLAEAIARNPFNVQNLRLRLRILCQLSDRNSIGELLQSARTSVGKKQYEDLRISALVHTADYAALLDLLSKNPGYGTGAIERELIGAITTAAYQKRQFKAAALLAGIFLTRFGKSTNVLLTLINVAFATRNWQFAQLCLATANAADFKASVELRLKRFEYYCFTGALDEAAIALKDLEPLSQLPKRRLPAVLRYYAEIGDWQSLYELGMQNLGAEFDFEKSGYLIFRAVRKIGMHVPAIREIEKAEDFSASPALKRLRTIVMEDMIRNGHMLEELTGDPHLVDLPALQQRLLFKKLVLQQRKKSRTTEKRYAIYYCTNLSYLGPTFVSLASLVENNRELMESSDIFLIVDEETSELAKTISAKVGKRYQVDIYLKTSKDVPGLDVELKSRYGLFTAGHSLAEAAYFRIYFASELQRQGRYEAALYIDSDTIIRGSLQELFDSRQEAPLLARLEMPRPEVDKAIELNNLEPGRYFNSGILFFDLKNPAVGPALDNAIDAVRHTPEALMYHDQCALNIGFKGKFRLLDDKFNHFVKPDEDRPISDGAIIHYLDRPKPWDPAYFGKYCGLWFANWHKLAIQIGAGQAMKLYNLSNKE